MIEESQLEEFVAWREAKSRSEVDLSPRAYLAELENEANRRRIQEAVNILAQMRDVYPSDYDGREATLAIEQLRNEALRAFDKLIGDRDIIIDQQFNGKAKVILT